MPVANQTDIPHARVNHNKYMVTDKVAYIGKNQLIYTFSILCSNIMYQLSSDDRFYHHILFYYFYYTFILYSTLLNSIIFYYTVLNCTV